MERDFQPLKDHDTIIPQNVEENENMGLFNVNWNDYKDDILKAATPETWSNDTYPNNGMLVNYMVHTFKKIKSENKVVETKD